MSWALRSRTLPSGCVWLASYPKSGNTWLRALLTAYLGNQTELDPNDIAASGHFSDRGLFELLTGVPSTYLTDAEVDAYRAQAIALRVTQQPALRFYKVHDRYRRRPDGGEVFPRAVTVRAVVIVRNPLAVVGSWAAHSGLNLDAAITWLAQSTVMADPRNRQHPQLPQPSGSWSEHVQSWLDQPDLPVTLVRYEDLRADPEGQLGRVLTDIFGVVDDQRVAQAVAACEFDRLRAREAETGFREAPAASQPFFRSGQTDGWRAELSAAQIDRVCADHTEMMARLGYRLPADVVAEP